MGIIPIKDYKPEFLMENTSDCKFMKYMFIRKGGQAIAKLGDVSDEEIKSWANDMENFKY